MALYGLILGHLLLHFKVLGIPKRRTKGVRSTQEFLELLAVVDAEAEVPEWVDYAQVLSSFEVVLDSRMALRCVLDAGGKRIQ